MQSETLPRYTVYDYMSSIQTTGRIMRAGLLFSLLILCLVASGSQQDYWNDNDPLLGLAPEQFKRHINAIDTLIDEGKYDEAIEYARNAKDIPPEWRAYLVADTRYELVIPEEKCLAACLNAARNSALPSPVRSRLYMLALRCDGSVYREDKDSIYSEIFSYGEMSSELFKYIVPDLNGHINFAHIGFPVPGGRVFQDSVFIKKAIDIDHHAYIAATFQVSADRSIQNLEIIKSFPEGSDDQKIFDALKSEKIRYNAQPGSWVILTIYVSPKRD